MINLGDITKISGYNAPTVDVVIGGSPCQDLSIAGKRAGLAGERSGLYMEQIRIIKEMREHDRSNGRAAEFIRPRYMVWENVPGAFSSNHGKDFAAVLEEAVRVIEPEAPPVPVPEKGWPTSGCLMGDGWSVAWRVLDAQFWGVPQRRRRIALVADFGGHTAPEILFVRESMSGDSETGRDKGKGTAGDAENGVRAAVDGVKCLTQWDCQSKRIFSPGGCMSTYQAMGDSGANNVAICIQGNCIDRADTAGCNGKGWRDDDVSFTLNTIDRPAVYAIENHPADSRVKISYNGVVQTLSSRMGTGGGNVPMCIGKGGDAAYTISSAHEHAVYMSMQAIGEYRESDVSSSCKQRDYKDATDLICAVDCRNGTENTDINGTLQSKPNGGMPLNLQNVARECSIVRRLTPLECERLQGFPGGWTDIGDWVDSKGKKRQTTDSARYKALGNSIALPPWKWVLKRLSAQYERDATMASLFDGIGGFPLIWEQLNGRGSCLWTSEIDEFPIAVTRQRFREEQ